MCSTAVAVSASQCTASNCGRVVQSTQMITGRYSTGVSAEYIHTKCFAPAARLADRFQVAWVSAASRTRATANKGMGMARLGESASVACFVAANIRCAGDYKPLLLPNL